MWNSICDSDLTIEDAIVACRQLTYSTIGTYVKANENKLWYEFRFDFTGANTSVQKITIPSDIVAPTVPQCTGSEEAISNCTSQNYVPTNNTGSVSSDVSCSTGVTCFVNDTAPSICFNLTASPPIPTPSTDTDDITQQTDSTPTQGGGQSTSPATTQTTFETTTSSFLTTPVGISVVVVIVVIIIFVVLLFIVIVLVLCRRSPVNKREQSRVSPQNLYYDDGSLKVDGDPFNNSPNQRRRVSETVPSPTEHHLLEQSPLYEQLKDVDPPSISSHDSGRSTDASDTNAPPTLYSTLERDATLPPPTYSTLERGQTEYAQVQPFINNGSLTRGATLISPVTDDVYHTLDRTTSQSSYTREYNRPGNSSPKIPRERAKLNSSPKQPPRNTLPSITDSIEAPTYAVLEETIEEASMISTNAVVSQSFSPKHSPALRHSPRRSPATRHSPDTRHSPGHRGLQHTKSHVMSSRLPTHDKHTAPAKQKSSTLPNSGRSIPSLPLTSRHRHSDYIEDHASNGVDTFIDSRLTASTQNNTFTSWV